METNLEETANINIEGNSDNLDEVVLREQPQIENVDTNERFKKILKIALIVQSSFLIIILVASTLMWITFRRNSKEISEIKTQNKSLAMKLNDVSKESHYNFLSILFQEGIVTNELTVSRISFYDYNNNGEISLNIGLQPSFLKYNKGQGKFDLPDRDLKASLIALVRSFETTYNEYNLLYSLPKFDYFKINLYYNNFPVATYDKGTLKLEGE